MENLERLTGARVLVTGGAGFIGAHVVELLLRKKCKVVVVDIQKPCLSYFFHKHLDKKTDYHLTDITKASQVNKVFISTAPSYVIHLAAEAIVDTAYDHPALAFKTNIMGTVNVLEACRRLKGLRGIIVASSDKVYGKTTVPYTEGHPLRGDHPYDVSKACEDMIAQSYGKTYGLPIVITRFGNVFGEGDLHYNRIIPGICKSMISRLTLEVRSDGTYVRDYLYVRDVARAYYFLLQRITSIQGNEYNIGSKNVYSVLRLLSVTEKILRRHIPYTIINTARNEIPYQHLSDVKIRKLGFRPVYTFEKAVKNSFGWYRKTI